MTISDYDKQTILKAFYDTIYLIGITGIIITILGLLIGFALYFSSTTTLRFTKTKRIIHFTIGTTIDIARSIPFIILMILIIPLTIILVGTMLGPKAAIPALIISAAPFYGRIVFNALREVPKGVIEALESFGASKRLKIKCLIKEALPALVSGLTVTLVSLVGFIAAAGAVGAGGLGDLARRKALALQYEVTYISVGILLLIVLVIQITGDLITKKIDKR